ncbi:DUF3231 family protein [Neobacillus soli]|uniref:DUF3231 family protein n=1 Tax=Neobacillus soli TaxID=220688 RepID=UPI000825C488|nr:DUF3231 family protein [Neobacillus soli]
MATIRPIKIGSKKSEIHEKLTSAEMGKLWATYMGNSMSECILSYFLEHVEDQEIKHLLEHALNLSNKFVKTTKEIFERDGFPIPIGFTKEDVNLGTPRLFEDEFYVHYLKYAAKAGMSIYNVAIPLMFREDVKGFFNDCMYETLELMEQIKDILMSKHFIISPPVIPIPEKVEFIHDDFLNGYIRHVRPLHALEITHLYDNIENNITSKALILAFSQVAKTDKVRKLFIKGRDLTHKSVEMFSNQLHKAHLPSPTFLDHLITTSTFSPFSDKLMLFHKVDMFSLKIRALGNSLAVNGRHDLVKMYIKSFKDISVFVESGAKIMIDNGWMEKPPGAIDRDTLS